MNELFISGMKKKYFIEKDMFLNNFTPHSAYVLGFIWADGWIRNTKSYHTIVVKCVKEDILNIYPIFNMTGNWGLHFRKAQKKNWKDCGVLEVSDKEVVKFLIENGYAPHSNNSPDILSRIPEKLHKYWFLGLSDGDGCWSYSKKCRKRSFSVSNSYDQDWSFLTNQYEKLDISYRIRRQQNLIGRNSVIAFSRKEYIVRWGEFLYSQSLITGLDRKYNKYKEIVDSYLK